MALTVGYDATAAVHQSAGIGRYTRQLLFALAARPDETRYRVVYSGPGAHRGSLPPLDGRFRISAIPFSNRLMNALWHRLNLPIPVQLFSGRFDLFHSPDFTLPPVLGRPTVLTVHDLAFLTTPEAAYPTLRAYLERTVPRSVHRATRVIAVSESTRHDLIRLLDVDPLRIVTVREGVDSRFRRLDQDVALERLKPLDIRPPYILAVGTLEPRKNYGRLFQAYAVLTKRGIEEQLVIAGGPGWLYEQDMQRLRELGLSDRVNFIQPSDEQLVALYSLARAFVYPSLYEGFALPPLEALACGAPVACSNTSSIPEVVGEAAQLFDPLDVEQMVDALTAILNDPELRARLMEQGLARAQQFTWERAAEQTRAVYEEALADA